MTSDPLEALALPAFLSALAAAPNFEQWVEVYPQLTFWYGLSYSELLDMPAEVKLRYWKALEDLKGEQQRMLVIASAYPHMKQEGQRAVQRMWEGEPRQPTEGEYKQNLREVGIAVVMEPPKKKSKKPAQGSSG